MSATAPRPTPPADPPRPWKELLAEQDGVLSRRQALLGGMSEDAWQWRLDTQRWRSLLPGIVVNHLGEPTERQRAWAAVRYVGSGAALTGDAALVQLGMRLPDIRTIHVAYPEHRDVRPQRFPSSDPDRLGVRLEPRRVRHLDSLAHPVRAPRLLRAAAAALHASAWAASDRAGEWRLAAAVQQGIVAVPALRDQLGRLTRLPRRRLIAMVLDDVELGAHAQSELDFLRFLCAHALPQPDRLQRKPRAGKRCYLDAWWERQRVGAEIDGAHHRLVGTWDADTLRANGIVIAERADRILLLRFTMGNLRHDGLVVAQQLRDVLL